MIDYPKIVPVDNIGDFIGGRQYNDEQRRCQSTDPQVHNLQTQPPPTSRAPTTEDGPTNPFGLALVLSVQTTLRPKRPPYGRCRATIGRLLRPLLPVARRRASATERRDRLPIVVVVIETRPARCEERPERQDQKKRSWWLSWGLRTLAVVAVGTISVQLFDVSSQDVCCGLHHVTGYVPNTTVNGY